MIKIILLARIASMKQIAVGKSGKEYLHFSLAVPRHGEKDKTDFFNAVAFGQNAKFISEYFSTGKLIFVDGTLQNNDYTDADGVEHHSDQIVVHNATFAGYNKNELQEGTDHV